MGAFSEILSKKRYYSHSRLAMGLSVKVIGGGLAGLATSFHLAESGKCDRITVCDQRSSAGLGGASNVAAGLMHPFTPQGKFIYKGLEGFEESIRLVKFAEHFALGKSLLSPSSARIVRPCFSRKTLEEWRKASMVHNYWISELSVEEYIEGLGGGLHEEDLPLGVFSLRNVHVIDSPAYLKALWAAIQANFSDSCEIQWEQGYVERIEEEMQEYDTVVVASGAGVQRLWEGALPFNYVRGQNIYFDTNEVEAKSTFTGILSGEYVCRVGQALICGATHEYGELGALLDLPPDEAYAMNALGNKVKRLLPKIAEMKPRECKAGIRVNSPRSHLGRLPVIAQHPRLGCKAWLMTGFGSRGLIHHAVFGKMLARAIIEGRDVPPELGLEV